MVIVWSARAERDLDAIAGFLEPLSPTSAARVLERIRKRVGDLILFPEGARRSDFTGLRELAVSKTPYIVIYGVKDDVISIVTVVHAKQVRRS